ncbi:hypothetical protein Purlil1_12092 [Purpureocillium lilacinum]|uniref:Uncharacterized protein n=1 Tax=Purpureocillium lilacinum TaxID=33203 RepID=A0ABR0BHU2_PURLI|nr:hypothetical protein Purlil1_12092 [Purpureocillium lilacinum]
MPSDICIFDAGTSGSGSLSVKFPSLSLGTPVPKDTNPATPQVPQLRRRSAPSAPTDELFPRHRTWSGGLLSRCHRAPTIVARDHHDLSLMGVDGARWTKKAAPIVLSSAVCAIEDSASPAGSPPQLPLTFVCLAIAPAGAILAPWEASLVLAPVNESRRLFESPRFTKLQLK